MLGLWSNRLQPSSAQSPESRVKVVATGITWPPRISEGTASVPLFPASDPAVAEAYPYATLYGIDVMLGDRPTQFVVDTGASNSVLSEALAESMQLSSTPIGRDRIASFVVGEQCSEPSINFYELPAITMDDARVEGISALGLPFSTNPTQTPGVLGMDFLSEFDVTFDMETKALHLRPPTSPDPDAIPLVGQIGLMTAAVEINNQGTFPFMLDTGAALTVLSQDLVERIALDLRHARPVEVIGFCGRETGQYLRLNQLAVGDRTVYNVDVIILDNPVLRALQVDGIVGQNFLSRYHQHWRFGEPDAQGFPQAGSLELTPIRHRE